MASFGAICPKGFRPGRPSIAPPPRWYFRKWSKDDTWILISNERGRPRGDMLHRLKVDKKPVPTVAVIDSQSVKNSSTATEQIGFDGGKLIKGRKRFLMVDTMGHLLWTEVHPANIHDGQAGVTFWGQAEQSTLCWMIWSCCTLTVRSVGTLRSSWKRFMTCAS